jgi:hypothetical protein
MEFYRLRFRLLVIGTAASGRLRPFDLLVFKRFERPLLVKADVHEIALGIVAGECLLYPRKRTFR